MEFIQNLLHRLKLSWTTMSFNQRVITGMVAGAALTSVVVFALWVDDESMVVLYSNLEAESAASVMDFLDQEGATYRVGAGGRTIEVTAAEVDRLRLRIAGERLVGDGHFSWADFIADGRMGRTQRELDAGERYAMEGELARSIETIDAIERARVHLNMSPRTAFVRTGHGKASASVVVTLRRRMQPSRGQVESVQHLVAGYVPELDPSAVTVIETSTGRALAGLGGDSATAQSNDQLRAQRELEKELVSKASEMLGSILGQEGYTVRVNADLDFEELERVAETYDPNTVVRSEGVAESEDPTKSRGVTNYEVNKTVDRILKNGSTIRKLTVAVAVDGTYEEAEAEGEAPTYAPRSDDELANIRNVVAAAVGLDPGRGDTIEVVNMRFHTPPTYEPTMIEQLHWLQDLPSLVGRFLLFLVAAFLVLRLRSSLSKALGDASDPQAGANVGGAGVGGGGATGMNGEVFQGVHSEVATLEDWTRGNPDQVAELVKAFAQQED
ncbi:MAG TPA: flagellar basal-body MS-ring/collar protein FliF [Candidatus Krumholzibacteria bacterium]|nr:flagellar basal-body MS-ring/collar protein FliF [Candidatus Krumholzibacteria bacterium]